MVWETATRFVIEKMPQSTNTRENADAFRRGPGGRPTRAEAERRHQVLLDTASRLFIARGLDAVSLDAIAEEAGVAKRFVYARYRDKGLKYAAPTGPRIEQLLVEDPLLLKTPVVRFGKEATVGFCPEIWATWK